MRLGVEHVIFELVHQDALLCDVCFPKYLVIEIDLPLVIVFS
jgi:hypothetical protein